MPLGRLAVRLDELKPDRATVEAWLEVYRLWYRDALCLAAGGDPSLLVNVDRQEDLTALAARAPLAALADVLAGLREAGLALEGHVGPRLVLEQTLAGLPARAA